MPFQDLPYRREDSAPQFDPSDPSVIERYFDDLEFLFIRHSVSDHQEKKRAAVNYPCVVTERLWKTAHAFSDPARSYEDFKAEIIVLYPEATAAHEYTRRQFDQLISDRARSPIRSEAELGQYFRKFLLVSRFLISKGRLGTPEQSRALMASFGPSLSIAVHSQLERQFPDHFYDDPYDVDVIYDATRLVLAWQQAAPLVYAPRAFPPPVTPTLAPPEPYSPPPPSICVLPPAPQSSPSAPLDSVTTARAPVSQLPASPAGSLRHVPPPIPSTVAPFKSIQPPPPSFPAFPPVPQCLPATPSDSANVRQVPTRDKPASLVVAPRPVKAPSKSTVALSETRHTPPLSIHTFPPVQELVPSASLNFAIVPHAPSSYQPAPLVRTLRPVLPPYNSTLVQAESRPSSPPPISAFPPVP